MIIDKRPIVDADEFSLIVHTNIDEDENIDIFLNGILSFTKIDIITIDGNKIYLDTSLDIDFLLDDLIVMYNAS